MSDESTIFFVCEHGAAKSIIAAAHFNKFAIEKNLDIRATARGTNPDAELSPKAVAGLQAEGLTPTEPIPKKLSLAEVESAGRVVTFCELPDEYQGIAEVERWDDIPPVSEDYEKARDAIVEKINQLMQSFE